MSQNITKNSYEAGRNTDVDPSLINPNQYISAYNVELESNGKFFALTNINGTTELKTFTGLPTDTVILNDFPSKYKIDGVEYKCITYFTVANGLFKVWCYNTESNDLYELFEEVVGNDYLTDNRVVDVKNYPENGVDVLYFTDFYHEIRYFKCKIDNYTPNFLSSYEISLLRKGSTGTIDLDTISPTGGSLLSGTYQFSYRMADPLNKRFTKWSTLSNPIHIYSQDNSYSQVNSGIGLGTTRKINLTINPSEIEQSFFEYMQVAVVENIGPAAPTTADILEIFPTTTGPVSFVYKSNTSIGTILLDDIVVDLAQVETVKTLNVKQNRLFAGNVKYKFLDFDGGVATPPPPITFPPLADWTNVLPANNPWALGIEPFVSVNGGGGESAWIVVPISTLAGYSYSFTFGVNVPVVGPSVPVCQVVIGILDAFNIPIDTFSQSFTGVGLKTVTGLLTPPSAGTYIGLKVINNTTFDTKNFEFESVAYNLPSAYTGLPSITAGSILVSSLGSPDAYSSDYISSTKIGHFRNEVYRYGIVYEDEDGNKSTVSPLNLGAITDNQITSGLTDVKFPDRSVNPTYALTDSSGNIKALGLSLQGVKSHPSWACSFEIVRMNRKKNILFQTPIIPMYELNGVGAIAEYPAKSVVPGSGGGFSVSETPDSQPMTSGFTYVPKNLFWPELRSTEKTPEAISGGISGILRGEVKLVRKSSYEYAMIFPQASMYSDPSPYVFVGNEKLDTVDYALLRCDASLYGTPPVTTPASTTGDYTDTSIIGSFFAVGDGQYFYDSSTAAKSILPSLRDMKIADYEFFDNGGAPASVAGALVLDYEAMSTKGTTFGYQPSVQKSAVVKLQSAATDLNSVSGGVVFKNGTLNQVAGGAYVFGSTGLQYSTDVSNIYMVQYPGYTNSSGAPGSNVSAIPIANMVVGLGDDRYGDANAFGEYVSTGAKYTFTAAERALLRSGTDVSVDIDVWGGDCFIGYHSFKICDSTYSITNQNKYYSQYIGGIQNAYKWNRSYSAGGDHIISMPVALKNSAQFIQVLLESEYNGEVRDIDGIPMTENPLIPVPRFAGDNETNGRTPLTYKYNLNLSRGNTQKVYFPRQQYSFIQNDFAARILWSDIKIYNSDQAGFDTFKVADYYDLEELRYGITKLVVAGDQFYAIQEQGIVYLPTGESQVEETNGGTLSIRSGDVIGRPSIIDTKRGSQHLRGIIETGGAIYIPDNLNKTIYMLGNQELKNITKDNETTFREVFSNQIAERYVIGVYDPVKRQYWFVDTINNRTHIFNEGLGIWIGSHEFTDLKGGVWANDNLWLVGNNTINTMYTNPSTSLFGTVVVPRVSFSVNPDESFSKTFDNVMISASERLESVEMIVEREAFLGNQTSPVMSVDNVSIEGNYRIKVLRDSVNARLRGLRALTTTKWKAGVKSSLRAFWTRYRTSSRTPF